MITADFDTQRRVLVDELRREGILDDAVLEAMRTVRREQFVPPSARDLAYRNAALPIANQQTISQPAVVAMMAAALELKPGDRVLEVGTGSGYAAAVLANVACEVYSVERHGELAETARRQLAAEGFANVHVLHGDGTRGWPEHAPFDAISVTAGGRAVPQSLLDQLRPGGRLIMPIGAEHGDQALVRIVKTRENSFYQDVLADVRFVPLVEQPD